MPRYALIATMLRGLTITNPPGNFTPGAAYSHTLNIIGGTAPYAVMRLSALPAGWSFNTSTYMLTAAAPLSTDIVILELYIADVGVENELEVTYVIHANALPLTIAERGVTAPDTIVGQTYLYQYFAYGGDGSASAFLIDTGALPPGLVLNPLTGAVTGSSTTPGVYAGSVRAASGLTNLPSANSVPFSITVTGDTFFRIDGNGDFRVDGNGDSRVYQ